MRKPELLLMAGLAACASNPSDPDTGVFEETGTYSPDTFDTGSTTDNSEAKACINSVLDQGRNDMGAMLMIGPDSAVDGIIQARSGEDDLAYDDLVLIQSEANDPSTATFIPFEWGNINGAHVIRLSLPEDTERLQITGHINGCKGTSAWLSCDSVPNDNSVNGCEGIGDAWVVNL
jgi:hypothetical protein